MVVQLPEFLVAGLDEDCGMTLSVSELESKLEFCEMVAFGVEKGQVDSF